MTMELEVEDALAESVPPVDCERLRRMSLAELLYQALVEWGGGWDEAAMA